MRSSWNADRADFLITSGIWNMTSIQIDLKVPGTLRNHVEQLAKANGANVTIKGFVRFETGEGIEKKEEDFAAEVAAQLK